MHVPGWHDKTREQVAAGKLVLLGVIQEQHAERCRLFAQWKQFTWPIVQDPVNLLGNRAVPIAIAIDEHGVVRSRRPEPAWLLGEFLNTDYPAPVTETALGNSISPGPGELDSLRELATTSDRAADWKRLGDAYMLWSNQEAIDQAIQAYQQAQRLDPGDGSATFRLGVAYRHRYELQGDADDFRLASQAWSSALDLDPNQYIWRRRIQQYGPRLDKPYPFYDWVDVANKEVRSRDETPIPLTVPLTLAEIAAPQRRWEELDTQAANPDPAARIEPDTNGLIKIAGVVVPAQAKPGQALRVHVDFVPNSEKQVHWTNDAGPLVVWFNELPEGVLGQQSFTLTSEQRANSQERRHLELEVKLADSAAGKLNLQGYALYYVCEEVEGACVYRRQAFSIPIQVLNE